MLQLLRTFAAIALRRLGPEDLPASDFLLGVTAAIYVALQLPVALLAFGPGLVALKAVAGDIALLSASLWLLLYLTGFRARYRQTLTAILGTGALLSLLSMPFSFWQSASGDEPGAAAVPSAAILSIVIWSFLIDGHILSRALSRPLLVGVVIAIAYFFVHTTLLFEFVPGPN